jgi:hypothetical protein
VVDAQPRRDAGQTPNWPADRVMTAVRTSKTGDSQLVLDQPSLRANVSVSFLRGSEGPFHILVCTNVILLIDRARHVLLRLPEHEALERRPAPPSHTLVIIG